MRVLKMLSLIAALAAISCTGCVVGPNYNGPPSVKLEGEGRRFVRSSAPTLAAAPLDPWWRALNDLELDRLEERALSQAPELKIAVARLRQARAGLSLKTADRRPQAGGFAAYVRSQDAQAELSGAASGVLDALPASDDVLQLYDAGFDASWEPDLFGGKARAVESARAAAQAAAFDTADAEVSLTAEIAEAYLQLRTAQQRLAHLDRRLSLEQQMLRLVQTRRNEGAATELDVERLRTQLQTSETETAPLLAQIALQQDRLAVLAGAAPGDLDGELQSPAALPLPPAHVAVGDPATLLRRRPDVRAAERRLQQQTAMIGVRTADLFPKISLVGDIGVGSTDLAGVLSATSLTYAVAPVLHWSPLDFGRTRARITQAEAARDEAYAAYRKSVLAALGDAEAGLTRYGRQAESLQALIELKASADRLWRLTELRWRGGTATSLDLLDAERRRVDADTSVVAGEGALTQDYVSLQKSLGLGWMAPSPVAATRSP